MCNRIIIEEADIHTRAHTHILYYTLTHVHASVSARKQTHTHNCMFHSLKPRFQIKDQTCRYAVCWCTWQHLRPLPWSQCGSRRDRPSLLLKLPTSSQASAALSSQTSGFWPPPPPRHYPIQDPPSISRRPWNIRHFSLEAVGKWKKLQSGLRTLSPFSLLFITIHFLLACWLF